MSISLRANRAVILAISMSVTLGCTGSLAYAADSKKSFIQEKERLKRALEDRREALARQEREDSGFSIFSRKHPEYDPLNVRVSSFVLAPSVEAEYNFVDNVFGRSAGQIEDQVRVLTTALDIRSDFARHQLDLGGSVDDGVFQKNKNENYRDYKFYANGRLEVSQRLRIPVTYTLDKQHSLRFDPEDVGGVTPTVFHVSSLQSGLQYVGGLFKATYSVLFKKTNYEDDYNRDGSLIYNGDRDREEIKHSLYLNTYESGRISPFFFVEHKAVDYTDRVDDFGFNRDSHGWAAGGGANIWLSGVTSATFKYGKENRVFEDPRFESLDSSLYAVNVNWEATSLLGLTLYGSKNLDEASLINTAANTSSAVGAKATYEIARNLYLYPEIKYLLREYQSTDNREIDRVTQSLKFSYKMNRNVWGTLSYENSKQDEERRGVEQPRIDVNKMMLSLKLQL